MTRADLGADWDEVLGEWYLVDRPDARRPSIDPSVAWEALGAVERLWPEQLPRLGDGARGAAVIAPVVALGVRLLACEHLVGFDDVLRRMRAGERSAASELAVAASLVELGYRPALEPELNGRRLDAVVHVEDRPVYIEVIAPEGSSAYKKGQQTMGAVVQGLQDRSLSGEFEIRLCRDLEPAEITIILDAAEHMAASATEDSQPVGGAALITYRERPVTGPIVMDSARNDGIVLGQASLDFAIGLRATVTMPFDDVRAQRLMEGEAHHFSKNERNLLIMDITRTPVDRNAWMTLIERRFQPGINTRFGAVALFRAFASFDTEEEWFVLPNPYAGQPIPPGFLNHLAQPKRHA